MEIITVQVFASTCYFLSIPDVVFSTLSLCSLLVGYEKLAKGLCIEW